MGVITTRDGTEIFYEDWGSGQRGQSRRPADRSSSKLVKDPTLKVYPGAPHDLACSYKDEFNEDLLSFIRT